MKHLSIRRCLRLLRMVACVGAVALPVAAQQQTHPCASGPFRDFDFWIGDWDVSQPDGTAAGTNRIEKILNGCALLENWTGVSGSVGKSLNQYDWQAKRWRQTWVDGAGQRLDLEGGLESVAEADHGGKRMVLRGERPALSQGNGGATAVLSEVSWTPQDDGSVVQHWRTSTDGGKTWSDAFIGIYRKASR